MTDIQKEPDGDLLDRVADLREAKAELAAQTKEIDKSLDQIEAELLRRMNDRKTDRLANSRMSASKSTTTEATVQDWEAVYEFIRSSGDFSLLHKRISAPVFRELLAMGQVPGIIPVEVTKVGFRKL